MHPAGGKVSAGLGRFGPYVVHDKGKEGKDYRSIRGDDHVLTITLGRALEMLAQPKMARGRRAEPKPVREVGKHPEDQQPINLFDGRYGPYVKHGDVSASIPRGQDPATVTLDQAVELIAARAGTKAGAGRKRSKKSKTKAAPKRVAEPKVAITASSPMKKSAKARRPKAKT
jgi:DNA topoisomerase-1